MVKFIADIGSNHNGKIARLHNMVVKAKEIGCWAVKPQIYRHDRLVKGESPFKKEWEFRLHWLPVMQLWCEELGLKLGATVYHEEDIEFVNNYIDFFKISAFDVLRHDLIKKSVDTGKPVFQSVGLQQDYGVLNASTIWMFGVSKYPTEPKEANLYKLDDVVIEGYSDHTRNPGVIYRATSFVDYIEFHMQLDGEGFETKTTDHCWDPEVMREVIKNVRDGDIAMQKHEFQREYYLQKADPSDGLRPMKEAR